MTVPNAKPVEYFQGAAAERLLEDPAFLTAWERLLRNCRHATCFQSPAYARVWYRHYRERFQPVLLRRAGPDGELAGLWLLAFNATSRELVHVGGHQAEYHVWLASPEVETEFLAAAWGELRRRLPFRTLRLRYLPARSLVETLRNANGIGRCMDVRVWMNPLLVLDAEEIRASFAKKSNKSRFSRLRKLGPLEFRRIRTPEELREVFDDIAVHYDLRQGAVNQATPFGSDPAKQPFHFALFETSPELVHVTVTLLNGGVIAALWGFVTGKKVHLELLAHSPLVAEHSPGKLHIMQLSEALVNEGAEVLDLTPGGDPWKERFATAHEETADVTLYRSALARRSAAVAERLLEWGKHIAARGGVRPSDVRRTWSAVQRASPTSAGRRIREWLGSDRELRIYRGDRKFAASLGAHDDRVRRNALADLLRFEPSEPWQSRERFLSAALSRLEQGESVFTILIDGRLAHCAWLVAEQRESHLTEVGQAITLPDASVAIYDFETQRAFRGRGLYRAMVRHLLHVVASEGRAEWVYISTLGDNAPSRRVIESLGFQHQGSAHLRRRWGVETKWTDPGVATAPVTR